MLPWGVGVGAAMPTISISYTETGHSAHLLQGWQLHLSVLQGQWDSTWDVEALRGAKQNIDHARKTKIQKLRADQEQERRDMETRHQQAVEEVRAALDLQNDSLLLLWACSWLAAGMDCLASSLACNICPQFETKGPQKHGCLKRCAMQSRATHDWQCGVRWVAASPCLQVNEEAKQQQADAEEAAVHSLQLKLMACSTEWQACQDAWRQAQGRLAGKLVEQFVEELRITEECFRQQALMELSADSLPKHKSRRRRKT